VVRIPRIRICRYGSQRTTDVRWRRLLKGPKQTGRVAGLVATVALVVGGLLLVWSGYIHFHLWDSEGYRHITTIGPLFLLQSSAGLILGTLILAIRRVWAALLGLGFALSTVAGFLISVEYGLFGFKDSWQAPFASQAFAIELTAAAILAVGAVMCGAGSTSLSSSSEVPVDWSSAGA
jgi:hypothetical protein